MLKEMEKHKTSEYMFPVSKRWADLAGQRSEHAASGTGSGGASLNLLPQPTTYLRDAGVAERIMP